MIEEFMELELIGKIVILISFIPTFYSIKYSNTYLKKYGFNRFELIAYYLLSWFHIPAVVFFNGFLVLGGIIFMNGRMIATGIILTIMCAIFWIIGFVVLDIAYNRGYAVRFSPLTINPFFLFLFIVSAPIFFFVRIPSYD